MQPSVSTCRVVRPDDRYREKQGFEYDGAVSAQRVGSRALCMHLITIPPGGRAKAHMHESHESAVYVLSGSACMWYGSKLEEHLSVKAGDFLYIPAGVPHLPYNPSPTESCSAVISRTDPNEQESVKLLPELEALVDQRRPGV